MNRVLARQLRRLGLSPEDPPDDRADWVAFLERVATYYEETDRSRYLLERSMGISSREMRQLNVELEKLTVRRVERSEQHYRHLFSQLPVPAWEEDFHLVAEHLAELRSAGITDIRSYFEAHPDALFHAISLVEIVDLNLAVADLLGVRNRSSLLGRVDPSAYDPDSLESWQREFEAIWRGEGRTEFEFIGQRDDGSQFPAILHWLAAEIDGEYDYSRVMVVVIDITDRKEVEDRMRQLVLAKDEFLASVSHELRTPLTSVLGYAELLMSAEVEAEEQEAMLATIADQAADLSNIVEDLLVGARAELGQLDVEAARINVVEIIDTCARAFPAIGRTLDASSALFALGDAARVRQILRNLLSNAERYGGDEIGIGAEERDGAVLIAVRDSGTALATATAQRIFDRYYRSEEENRGPGSVGIGLTISRDLARLMGGDLIYRHDGRWSTFELSLPAATSLRAVG